jgi:gamma-glutamylcyclotransferase (GGCT)/AIG2-like uncharacterized protein YtfP
MRLFLYGTLLDPAVLARFAGRPMPLTPATLPGWHRVALRNTVYPTLRRARGEVAGATATVDARTLARLAAYEGPRYHLTQVAVRTTQGTRTARTWIAPGGTRRDWLHQSDRA